jgi:hypothetical protein
MLPSTTGFAPSSAVKLASSNCHVRVWAFGLRLAFA